MTEDQYQQIRQFVKLNKHLYPQHMKHLKAVLNDAKNIRNRVFSFKARVIKYSRVHERYNSLNTENALNVLFLELKAAKLEFSKFLFDTSNYSSYQSNISDREKYDTSRTEERP